MSEMPERRVILNDALGRRIARLYHLAYTGTLGILIRAKQQGHIPTVLSEIQALQTRGMWITRPVIETILQLANEQP